MTDYTCVSLKDILDHLRDWHRATQETADLLRKDLAEVESKAAQLGDPDDIRGYLRYFLDLLHRYASEFERLLEELPQGVTQAHMEAVTQLQKSSAYEENRCVEFKKRHIMRGRLTQPTRQLLDEIYGESRDLLIYYKDLSNLAPRLGSLIGTAPVVKLKPEFHGVGLDVRGVFHRLLTWLRRARFVGRR